MTREEVLQALNQINRAIAVLDARLHPPPLDPNERNELNAEMAAAQQSRTNLLNILNNLPPSPAALTAPAARTLDRHRRSEHREALGLAQNARKRADELAALMNPPAQDGPAKKKKKKA